MSVPRSVPTSRYGRLCPTNGSLLHTATCWSFDLSKQPIFRYMGILPGCCSGTFRLLSVSFLYGPTASWANGDTFCLCRPSNLRNVTVRKSLLFVCPADRFLPAQAVIPFIICLLYRPQASSSSICYYCLLSFPACHRIGFIGCECRLSRLILPF